MRVLGIIPARLQSTRLPRKLLLAETGHPLLQYGWAAACKVKLFARVIIATDSEEIAETARKFGAEVEMTGEHPSGTDRIAEVADRHSGYGLIVNLQGDEPEIDPETINDLIRAMATRPGAAMGTLATTIRDYETLQAPSCVKVVCDSRGRALYFSRAPIPFMRDGNAADSVRQLGAKSPWKLHIGVYAYRPDFLKTLTKLPPSPLEQLEKLEQLRALEAGAYLHVEMVQHRAAGIDTREDYEKFVERCRRANW